MRKENSQIINRSKHFLTIHLDAVCSVETTPENDYNIIYPLTKAE